MKIEEVFVLIFILVFGITAAGLKFFIPFLSSRKMGQKILDIGPRWHKNKEGTPTMGGIVFVFAAIISFFAFLIMIDKEKIEIRHMVFAFNIIIYALLNAMIGLIDDFSKLRKSKNQGLTGKAKFAFQSIAALLFLLSMHFTIGISTKLYIPFFDVYVEMGALYYVIAFIALCGVVNSVNLTDGIDGLASSITLTVGVFFAIVNIVLLKDFVLSYFSAMIIGATLGFLVYNFYPAKIFMGDTGSLFLGALVVSLSFFIDNILLVLIYGFIFVCEALSDVLQVLYFKITKGKRLLKMAPLHHHFEKCGYNEVKIVLIFTLVNAVACFIAFLGLGKL